MTWADYRRETTRLASRIAASTVERLWMVSVTFVFLGLPLMVEWDRESALVGREEADSLLLGGGGGGGGGAGDSS